MYPAAFDYYRAGSVPEAIALLGQHPDSKLLAGGHSLLPWMKLRLARPAALIDIGRIPGLSGVRDADDRVVIGPTTTYWRLMQAEVIRSALPLMAESARTIGDLQVRNRGTIGGSVAHADPASNMPAVVLALDATIRAAGPSGERDIAADDFFIDLFTTALEPGEIITEIRVPKPPARTGMAYSEFSHPASGYPVVGVCAVVTLDADGRVQTARVALTGVGPKATRATATERMLAGRAPTPELIAQAAEYAAEEIDVDGDIFADPDYRRHLTRIYTDRALAQALGRMPSRGDARGRPRA